MRRKLERIFAFVVTALMVFECVPAIAWAEMGEALASDTVTVTFDPDIGSFSGKAIGESETRTVERGATLLRADFPEDPTSPGGAFMGWKNQSSGQMLGTGDFTDTQEDRTLKASFAKHTFTINYSFGDGVEDATWSSETQPSVQRDNKQPLIYGNELTIYDPVRPGWVFDGWAFPEDFVYPDGKAPVHEDGKTVLPAGTYFTSNPVSGHYGAKTYSCTLTAKWIEEGETDGPEGPDIGESIDEETRTLLAGVGLDGLVSHIDDGVKITGIKNDEEKGYKRLATTRADESGTPHSVFKNHISRDTTLEFSEPCWVVFDVAVSQTGPDKNPSAPPNGIQAYFVRDSLDAASYYQPPLDFMYGSIRTASSDSEQAVCESPNWHTVAVNITSDRKALSFGTSDSYGWEVYVTNVRVYENLESVPDSCLQEVDVKFEKEHGSVQAVWEYPNNAETMEVTYKEPGKYLIPMFSKLKEAKFVKSHEDVFVDQEPALSTNEGKFATNDTILDKVPYTLEAKTSSQAQHPDSIRLLKRDIDAGTDAWEPVKDDKGEELDLLQHDNWVEYVGISTEELFKLEVSANGKSYTSVSVTDATYDIGDGYNGEDYVDEVVRPLELGDDGTATDLIECHGSPKKLTVTFSQDNKSDFSTTLYLWPGMSLEQAFGYSQSDGTYAIDGLETDYTDTFDPSLILEHDGSTNGAPPDITRSFVYDAEYTELNGGSPVFSTRPTDHSVGTTHTMTFTAERDGIFSLEYYFPGWIKSWSGSKTGPSFYIYKNDTKVINYGPGSTFQNFNAWNAKSFEVSSDDVIRIEFNRYDKSDTYGYEVNNGFVVLRNIQMTNEDKVIATSEDGLGTNLKSVTAFGPNFWSADSTSGSLVLKPGNLEKAGQSTIRISVGDRPGKLSFKVHKGSVANPRSAFCFNTQNSFANGKWLYISSMKGDTEEKSFYLQGGDFYIRYDHDLREGQPKVDDVWISDLEYEVANFDLEVSLSNNGAATFDIAVGDETLSDQASYKNSEVGLGQVIKLTAKPADDCTFYGWYEDGKLVESGLSYEFTMTEAVKLELKAARTGTYQARIGETLYEDLATAIGEAKPQETVILLDTVTLENSLTIPEGITLLLPSSLTDTGLIKSTLNDDEWNPNGGKPAAGDAEGVGKDAKLFSKLVVPSGKTLTINGTVLVNAITGRDASGAYDMDVTGGYGQIDLAGNIVVNSGGMLDVFGYVTGAGSVEAKSGSTVSDLYIVRHWRGGSQASNMVQRRVYPMSEYDLHNIEVPVTIHSGAKYMGFVKMFAAGSFYTTRFPQVDNENGLIRLASGATAVKSYDKASERETYSITGGAKFDASMLPIIGIPLTTADYVYPWDGDIDFKLANGDYNFNQDFKFLPGATISATKANVTVNSGAEVVLYHEFNDVDNAGGGEYPNDRHPAVLTLDAESSFTNNGAFAGDIETATGKFSSGSSAKWQVTTQEANGYYANVDEKVRTLTFTQSPDTSHSTESAQLLGITRNGFSWQFGKDGRTVEWLGADLSELQTAIEAANEVTTKAMQELGGSPSPAQLKKKYTDEAADRFWNARSAAMKLKSGAPGSDRQDEVNAAAKELKEAVEALETSLRSFNVTFSANGGTLAEGTQESQQVTYGQSVDAWPKDPHRDGYDFDGWTDSVSNETVSSLENVREAHTLTAQWTLHSYTITYASAADEQGKPAEGITWPNGQDSKAYTIEDANAGRLTLGTPARTGYKFSGWTVTKADGGETVAQGVEVTIPAGTFGDLTATAAWTPLTFEVTFDPAEGKLYADDESEEPLDASTYTVIVTYDKTFGDATLKGAGTTVGLPTAKREGYKPGGWQHDGATITNETQVKITANAKLVETWQVGDSYSITYDLNDAGSAHKAAWEDGGAWKEAHQNYNVVTPDFTLPAPTREGYTFLGWSRNGAGDVENPATVTKGTTGNLGFTAQWQLKSYDFELDGNGGKFDATSTSQTLTKNHFDVIGELPEPSRNGYTFAGWKDGSGNTWISENLASQIVTGSMKLQAQWDLVSYTLTFNLNQGSWSSSDAESGWGTSKSYTIETGDIQLPRPEREGYTFQRWETTGDIAEADGSDLENGHITTGSWGDVTFTAVWQVNTHSVTWVYGNDQVVEIQNDVAFGTKPNVPTDPTRAGYRFDGWQGSNGTLYAHQGDLATFTMPDENVTFTAKWTSYLTLLQDMESFEGKALNEADGYFKFLTDEQKKSYNATSLISALLESKIEHVNEILNREDTGKIATLSVDTSGDTPTILVYMDAPHTKAKKMLEIQFLQDLFGCQEVTGVTIDGRACGSMAQMEIMLEVAFSALGTQQGYTNPTQFRQWLVTQEETLEIGSLAGTTVYAKLVDAHGTGPTYAVSFYDADHKVGEESTGRITFDLDGGQGVTSDMTAKAGTPLTNPGTPKKTGYDFDGWYTEPNGGGEAFAFTDGMVMPEGTTSLHAKWKPYHYTINFDKGSAGTSEVTGTLPEARSGVAYDEDVKLPESGLSARGYTFSGWKLSGSGEIKQAGDTISKLATKDGDSLTLTAQWTPETYKVTLDPGSDQASLPEDAPNTITVTYDSTYGAAPELSGEDLPTPVHHGYAFVNWVIEGTDTVVSRDTLVATAGAHTLVAKWRVTGNTAYTVVTKTQTIEGGDHYDTTQEQFYDGKADEPLEVQVNVPTGFHLNTEASKTRVEALSGEGDTVLTIVYDRDVHTVTWVVPEADEQPAPTEFLYGQTAAYKGTSSWEDDSSHRELKGWGYPAEDGGEVEALEAMPEVTGDLTLEAVLERTFEAQTPDGATTWRTLKIAMEKAPKLLAGATDAEGEASSASTPSASIATDPVTGASRVMVVLHGKASEDGTSMEPVTLEGSLTVPASVMLLLPYGKADTGYDTKDNGNQHIPGPPVNYEAAAKPDTPYSTLVVPSGATLTVEGTVLANALIGHAQGGNYDQDVTGGWSLIEADGAIVVASGGTLDAHGYVRGSGSVTAQSGGTVGDLYVVRHWRGGSQALAMYDYAIYPYSEYDCQHVEVPLTIASGGRLDGLVTMYAAEGYYSTRFPQVDNQNGLIRLNSGASATRTLARDGEGVREQWAITGGATFSRSTLYIIQINLSTAPFLYPIDGDIDLTLKGGTYAFDEDYKFLPGATLTAEGARVVVNPESTVVFYERMDDPENTGKTQYPANRGAAVLSLDATSSLMNYGTFAGRIATVAANVQGSEDATWSCETLEANGYFDDHVGNEARTLGHDLSIVVPSHTWRHSRTGRLLWDGEPDEPIQDAILEDFTDSIGQERGTEDVPFKISVEDPADPSDPTGEGEDGFVAFTIDVGEKGLEEPASSLGYGVMQAFLSAAHENRALIASVSTISGQEPELVYQTQDEVGSWPRLFAQKLGLVKADAPEVGMLSLGPTVEDLVGRHCELLLTSVKEQGMAEPATVTYDLHFVCTEKPDPYAGLIAVYRLYNPWSGEHLLSVDTEEYDYLATLGWKKEGIQSYQEEIEESETASALAAGAKASPTYVYRLYNPWTGDHLYTASNAEVTSQTRLGWEFESALFKGAEGDDPSSQPIYRLYNPWSGQHLMTASKDEYDYLATLGWKQEDVCWYAEALPKGIEA